MSYSIIVKRMGYCVSENLEQVINRQDNVGSSENIASKVSRATRRLLPFNEEGLKETTETPNLQGRKLRNRIVNNLL